MKKIFLTFVAVAMSVVVFGQSGERSSMSGDERPTFEWGVRASAGANYHHYPKGAYDGKEGFAWDAGLVGQWNFSKSFGLRTAPSFQHRMARMGAVGVGEVFNMSNYGLTVPLELVWLSTPDFPVYLFAGGYYSRNFGARLDGEKFSSTYNGVPRYVNKNEWGIRYGLGVDVTKRLAFEMSGQQALGNVFDSGVKMRNYTLMFSIVWKF